MFSGKSEELIRRLRRANIARRRVQVFKPRIDDRYHKTSVASHSALSIDAVPVDEAWDVLKQLDDRTEVVGIDEAQFFDADIVDVVEKLANLGKRVVVAGLDQDYLGRPFEPVPAIMAIAEYVTKCLAVCVRCGAPANRTQRLVSSEERVVVGAVDSYEARCRQCFEPELTRQLELTMEDSAAPSEPETFGEESVIVDEEILGESQQELLKSSDDQGIAESIAPAVAI